MTTKLDILAPLNEEQRYAVMNYNGRMSLESTSGSGKTFTLVSRCQYMVKEGVKPSRILVFTFTKKAASELRERISSAIGTDADKMTVCTYHSFCGKILRKFPEYTGREKNFTIYDEDEKKALLKKLQSEFKQAPAKLGVILTYISNFKAKGLSPQEAMISEQSSPYGRICAMIYQAYEKELLKRNAFDFDDLPFFAYKLVSNHKEVLDYVTSCYDYILSDENQDANKQNMDFIMLIGSRTNNIFVVGDTDQSIYGFRGADVDNVIKTYKEQDFNIRFLSANYRCTKNIVEASGAVIAKNTNRIVKTLRTDNEVGSKIKYVKCMDQIQEASYIVQKIKELKKENPALSYSDFAVLSRLQSETSVMEQACLTAKVPYKLKGGVPFYSRTEIKDIVAYLKLAYNPKDTIAFERIVNVPKRGIGNASIEKIILSKYSLDDIISNKAKIRELKLGPKAQYGLENLVKVLNSIRDMIRDKKNVGDILNFVVKSIDYVGHLEKTIGIDDTLNVKKSNVSQLISLGNLWNTDFEEFLINAYLGDDSTCVDEDGKVSTDKIDGVSIMTIHSSKGLEFNTVFIFDCCDNFIPFVLSHNEKRQVEEERRLFFVAMTRAKKNLFLMYPTHTCRRDGVRDSTTESRFVKEIPQQYLEKLLIRSR